MADKKIATYICTGCGIADALDIDALAKEAEGTCKTHEALCGEEGLAIMRQDVADDGVTNALVVACSARAKQQDRKSVV